MGQLTTSLRQVRSCMEHAGIYSTDVLDCSNGDGVDGERRVFRVAGRYLPVLFAADKYLPTCSVQEERLILST